MGALETRSNISNTGSPLGTATTGMPLTMFISSPRSLTANQVILVTSANSALFFTGFPASEPQGQRI
jgi:hypothetical protein